MRPKHDILNNTNQEPSKNIAHLKEINKVINTLTNNLMSYSHLRIEYPKAAEKVKATNANAGVREEVKQALE